MYPPTQTIHCYKENPSRLPYIQIVWFPQNMDHLYIDPVFYELSLNLLVYIDALLRGSGYLVTGYMKVHNPRIWGHIPH